MATKTTTHVPIDDLRRFAIELGAAAGLSPARASILAGLSLWSDEAGRPDVGVATLPSWLDRLASGEFDPRADPEIARPEPASAAVLDGARVLPHLALDRAAAIASEKAREGGIGLVRVVHLADPAPAAAVAAGIAVGPTAALILGPDRSLSVALPTAGSLPIAFDSTGEGPSGPSSPDAIAGLPGMLLALVGDRECLVLAASAASLLGDRSPLDRLIQAGPSAPGAKGLLLPGAWEERRRLARESGLPISKDARDRLRKLAERLGVPVPWGRR